MYSGLSQLPENRRLTTLKVSLHFDDIHTELACTAQEFREEPSFLHSHWTSNAMP